MSGWKIFNRRSAGLCSLVLAGLLVSASAQGVAVTYTGSQGDLEASVTFEIVGSDLLVTLTNVSEADVLVPIDVLTAVFFDIEGDPILARTSAVLDAGSVVHFGGTDPGDVVGGEWAYKTGLSGAPGDNSQGISSVGLGLFGPPYLFPGSNLDGPASPNGLNYGITSAGDDVTTGNTPVTGTRPLIQDSVVFELGGVPDGLTLDDISNVWFQYGTSLDEPSFPHAPEPTTILLLASAVGAFSILRRRKKL